MAYFLLVLAFLFNSFANLLFKAGASGASSNRRPSVLHIGLDPLLIAGLFLFFLNALCYYHALKSIPISVAYPVMVVMSFLIINSAAHFWFKEPVYPLQLVGYFLIVTGLTLVVHYSR